ncbi:hypothetical protein [Streptomyces sp. NPDC058092]|uniref:hypothetical protein n=1 Tax=Streptomyces sp. NPDC058092 TaxID=3346336 RepID=UPI0036E2BDC0
MADRLSVVPNGPRKCTWQGDGAPCTEDALPRDDYCHAHAAKDDADRESLADFPGQLITQRNGFTFKRDPGAKGGKVYDEDDALRGAFIVMDVGDADTPLGVYVKAWQRDEFVYADTYDGAAGCILAAEYGAEDAGRRPGNTWSLFNIDGDDDTHAVTDNGKVSVCGKAVSFPVGSSEAPTCPACASAVADEPERTP